jgi:hypothetical protein
MQHGKTCSMQPLAYAAYTQHWFYKGTLPIPPQAISKALANAELAVQPHHHTAHSCCKNASIANNNAV